MPLFLDSEGFYTNQKCFILTGEKLIEDRPDKGFFPLLKNTSIIYSR